MEVPTFGKKIRSRNSGYYKTTFATFAEWYLKNIKHPASSKEMVQYIKDEDLLMSRFKSDNVNPSQFGMIISKYSWLFKNQNRKWYLKEKLK